MGFADCKETAIRVSGEIPDSEVYYGLYLPTKPKEEWDRGWDNSKTDPYYGPIMTHFWVQKDSTIFDYAVDQYGETQTEFSTNDKRYVVVGKMDADKKELQPLVLDPSIKWSTLTGAGGNVEVSWNKCDEYMRNFRNSEQFKEISP